MSRISKRYQKKIFKASQSKVKTWRRCHKAYTLKYVEKLEANAKSRPLQFGTMVHKIIEVDACDGDWKKSLVEMSKRDEKLFRVEREAWGDLVGDVRLIMGEYFDFHRSNPLTYLPVGKRKAEHDFELPLRDGIVMTGKIDAYAKTKNGLRWLVEHKSFKRLPNEDARWRNIQAPIYTRANEKLGHPRIDGIMWDYIWSKPPSRPQKLKSGKLAKRSIVTLPTAVRETIKEHGMKERDYSHVIAMAEKNRGDYFQRFTNPIKKIVVDDVWADFIETATEMRDLHGVSEARNIDRHCDWCDFEKICRAELTGGDVDFIKEHEYHERIKESVEVNAE